MPGPSVGKINLPQTTLHFFDLGGQRDIRQIWPKYYDECHAVVFVLDSSDQARLGEGWSVFDSVLTSPRLLNLPLLLVANKQDSTNALSPAEIRESFDAWHRARMDLVNDDARDGQDGGNDDDEQHSATRFADFDGAKADRMASLDVLGISALTGDGVKEAVNWLYLRVKEARPIE